MSMKPSNMEPGWEHLRLEDWETVLYSDGSIAGFYHKKAGVYLTQSGVSGLYARVAMYQGVSEYVAATRQPTP